MDILGLLMDGILTQAAKDADVVKVYTVAVTMLGRLKELREKIPVTMRHNPNLRILMSVEDFDTYDDELTSLVSKGKDATEVNVRRYKGIRIEDLTDWPQGLIVATICSDGLESNLFAAVSPANDENVIRIEQMANGSEYYFFKMLMKGDTNIGFGEEFIALDRRESGAFALAPAITVNPSALAFIAAGETKEVEGEATEGYTIGSVPAGFAATKTPAGISVTASVNGSSVRGGTLTLTLMSNTDVSAGITLTQAATAG